MLDRLSGNAASMLQSLQPLKRGPAVKHKVLLRAMYDDLKTLEQVSRTLSLFMSAPKTGFRLLLYRRKRELEEESMLKRIKMFENAKVPDAKKAALEIGPEPCIIETDYIIKLLMEYYAERTGLPQSDGICVVLEVMTVLILGPVTEEEMQVGENSIRKYSQLRTNLFRHFFDCMNYHESKGRYNCGLGHLIFLLAHSLGCPHSVLQILRAYCTGFPSTSALKDLKSKVSIIGHMQAVCMALVEDLVWTKDNFIRTLKVGKTIGGKIGAYVIAHYNHTCVKALQVAIERVAGWRNFMRLRPNETCWRCQGKEQPADGPHALCHNCVVTPPTPIGEASLQAIKNSLRAAFPSLGDNMISPMLFSPVREGVFDNMLSAVARATDSSGTLHASREAMSYEYEQYRAAMQDRATYSIPQVEDPDRSGGALTISLTNSDTNNPLGLIRDMIKTITHPLIGPALAEKRFLYLADIKIYKAIEGLYHAINVCILYLLLSLPKGLLLLLDIGLRVVKKYSGCVWVTFDSIMEIYWNTLIGHAGGKGFFFKNPNLSSQLALFSAVYQAYARPSEAHGVPSNRDILLAAMSESPHDPVLASLVSLHELHLPLLMYYAQCIRLGRDQNLEVRREAFDVWFTILAPLMVVTIAKVGSHEYSKCLLQFLGKLHHLKEHQPDAFNGLRDNFANVMDSEPIELIYAWISNNCKCVNLEKSDSEHIMRGFFGKPIFQRIKFEISRMLGLSVQSSRGGVSVTKEDFLKASQPDQATDISTYICIQVETCMHAHTHN